MQWLETKEVWDKEKVCMAEMGYIPDEATGVSSRAFILVHDIDLYEATCVV